MSDEIDSPNAFRRGTYVSSDAPSEFPGGGVRQRTGTVQAFATWGRRTGVARKFVIGLMVCAVAAGLATFFTLTGNTSFGLGEDALDILLVIDLALVLALGAVVSLGLVRIWAQRRAGLAGARLHVRLVGLFSVVAIAPAILVAVLAALFFNLVVESWFSERVREAVESSVLVSEAYLDEHRQSIRADAQTIAEELNRVWPGIALDPQRAREIIEDVSEQLSVPGAVLFDQNGRVIARAGFTSSLLFDLPPTLAVADAARGQPVVLTSENEDRVRALVGLDTRPQAFLYVGRFIDPNVLRYRETTKRAANEYAQAETRRSRLELELAAIFAIVTLLLLLTAVGVGLGFANRLSRHIANLVHAAELVRSGNLGVQLREESRADDEIGMLTRAFNRMTRQLDEQRGELTEANRQLEDRRRFTEAVLAGVSAGVIGLDRSGRVNLPNRPATALLGVGLEQLMGRPLAETIPPFADAVSRAIAEPDRLVEDEITVETETGRRTLHVRIAAERDARADVIGFVVTFDDVTELQSAQRKAAWADVARRIAHEIKNPLTPIQLSAERLKRKYLDEVKSDPETFAQCTDTIVRQVGDIGRMVDEFSSFARMPNAVFEKADLSRICREALFLQQQAHRDIRFDVKLPDDGPRAECDSGLLNQALTNLLQNAVDAIEGREDDPSEPGWISMELSESGGKASIVIEDNGRGLPVKERERLTEPYVTTRTKGTGLGLAIVSRIVEQHGGSIRLDDREAGTGARISVRLPLEQAHPARHRRPETGTG
ncbi:MAG: PAS domain-containing sensor histidine kinase [Alphaproteobacteria bacterium]|nr:PAS domain-containing sensor histidine kinase [Alphaproteobacteria bacterium]